MSVFRYSYSSTDLKYSWHTQTQNIYLNIRFLIWIKINVTKIFFFIIPYGKIFPFPWMNESHQTVSQLLKALLQFALASFHVYPKRKRKMSINIFCLTGPRGLIWSPHLLCGQSSTQTVFYKFSRDKVCSFPSDSKLVAFSKQRVLDNIGQQDKSWNARFHLYWLSLAINAASGLGFCRHKGYFSKRGFSYSKTGEILH